MSIRCGIHLYRVVPLHSTDRASRMPCHVGPWSGAREMRRTARLRAWVPLAVVLALLLGSSLRTWAHGDLSSTLPVGQPSSYVGQAPQPWFPAAQPTPPATPGAPLTFMLFVLMAVALARGAWRWRRTAALGFALVLGIFTLGIAVHSVHHLSEPGKAAECLVFSASQHMSGTLAELCDVQAPVLAVTTASPGHDDGPILTHRFRSDLPRAPPAFLS
jgi:hypothetical protein